MKVVPTPFGGMLPSVSIEDSKEALTANAVKVDDEGMRILHRSPGALFGRETNAKCGVIGGMTVQYLRGA